MKHGLLILLTLGLYHCASGGMAFKKATTVWSAVHSKKYVQYILKDDRYENDADRGSELMAVAGLACLIERDKQATSPQILPCLCAEAKNKEQRSENCKKWAYRITGKKETPNE